MKLVFTQNEAFSRMAGSGGGGQERDLKNRGKRHLQSFQNLLQRICCSYKLTEWRVPSSIVFPPSCSALLCGHSTFTTIKNPGSPDLSEKQHYWTACCKQ